ncbi:MAG: hypothetical protein JWQ66_4457 [Mucilaginibacter sp.]|nr:hypothetical protein [Mucilaginibacter sp.]
MATGYLLWMHANSTLDYEMKVESDNLKQFVTPESQQKFLELSCGSATDYRKMIRAITGKKWTS